MAKKLKVTQVRSIIGKLEPHKRTIKALGLRKIRSFKIHDDTPCIRGMINSVNHLVKVEIVDGE